MTPSQKDEEFVEGLENNIPHKKQKDFHRLSVQSLIVASWSLAADYCLIQIGPNFS